MSRAIKLKNNDYLDSGSIIHKNSDSSRNTLNIFIDEYKALIDEVINNRLIVNSKIMVRQNVQLSISSGNYIPWNEEVFNNSNGLLENYGSGLIKVNHTGYIKLSFSIWFGGSSTYRPWVQLKNYTTNEILLDSIDDSSSAYVSISGGNIIVPVTAGDMFGIAIDVVTSPATLNRGSGRGKGTYFTVEIIK